MNQTSANGNGQDKGYNRYADYRRLRIDWPHERVIRVTMVNGKMNSADATMHAELGRIWRDLQMYLRHENLDRTVATLGRAALGVAYDANFARIA